MVHDALPNAPRAPQLGKFTAAIVFGLGIGTLASPSPVPLPRLGSVPGLVAGTTGILAGASLYLAIDRTSSGCDCTGNCSC